MSKLRKNFQHNNCITGGKGSGTTRTAPGKAALLLLAIAPLSVARLGETLDQCKTGYGAPTGQYGEDEFIFTRGYAVITVHFRANRSVQEEFGPDAGSTLSEAQVAEILQENSEGSTWEVSGDTPVAITYFRKDGRAAAQCAKKRSNTHRKRRRRYS